MQGLYRGIEGLIVDDFERDMREGKLPQVSWIVGPTKRSEHANVRGEGGAGGSSAPRLAAPPAPPARAA